MASSVQQVVPQPTADVVGNAFVHQYYLILHQSPELVHRFYQDTSKLGRPGQDGVMTTTTTMQAINEKIISLDYGDFSAQISTVDAQESYNGGVLVFVTGYLTGKGNLRQKFSQSFFLAPQDKGYFVLNDVFRYVGDAELSNEKMVPVNNVEAPLTPTASTPDHPCLQENHIPEQPMVSEEVNEGVSKTSEIMEVPIVEEEEAPVPEVVDEIPNASETVVESNTKTEEAPKKSYASIVKVMKENYVTLSTSAPAVVRSIAKSQQQQLTAVSPAPLSEMITFDANVVESGNNQEGEANSCSIYIRGLPISATPTLLENEFKKFGPIKSGGIQVRSQKGVCFGFVEFEVASAVQSAIEASPITIGGRQAVVEEKRSTSRGNRGRFSSGRGSGFRNDGPRVRGNYGGGRGGRGEYNNRSEFGNRGNGRGGYSNRGGDGYQRAENMGNGGVGRTNRAANAAAGTMPQQVPAPA